VSGYISTSAGCTITAENIADTIVQMYRTVWLTENDFEPIGPLVQILPAYSGAPAIGTNSIGNEVTSIPVSEGDRLVLVATRNITGSNPYSAALLWY